MHAPSNISLITIDLDDTVWPCMPVILAAEHALVEWFREAAPRLARAHDQESLRRHRLHVKEQNPGIAHDITAVRTLSVRLLLREFGYPTALAERAMECFMEARNRVQPFPEVRAALSTLGARRKLVSVTNGNADVRRTSLRDCFDLNLCAAAAGASKPAPHMFRMALAWAGANPQESLHAGDDPLLDVDAARRVGMRTAWVNREGAVWPEGMAPPDVTLSDLSGLATWLDALGVARSQGAAERG